MNPRWSIGVLAVATAVVLATGAHGQDEAAEPAEGIAWFDGDLDAAQAQAVREDRPLMAYFTFET